MFTGIVEELGRVRALTPLGDVIRMDVAAATVMSDLAVGDSIAVNGVCLTAVALHEAGFAVEIVPETLRRSSLGALQPGDSINLERSVTPTTRMGGHFVQGHVDGRGEVLRIVPDGAGGSVLVTIGADPSVMRFVVPKGFICVDGASLTIVDHDEVSFRIALIPHTLEHTIAGAAYAPGHPVNLEADILGKYIARLLEHGTQDALPALLFTATQGESA